MIFDVEKFELIGANGKTTVEVYEKRTVGPFWNRTRKDVITKNVTKDFNIVTNDPSDIPAKEDCAEYFWSYEGEFEVVNIFFYNKHIQYQPSPVPYILVTFVGHRAIDVPAECLSYEFSGDDEQAPHAKVSFQQIMRNRQREWEGMLRIHATYSSRDQLQEYTSILEPEDNVVVAKLSSVK